MIKHSNQVALNYTRSSKPNFNSCDGKIVFTIMYSLIDVLKKQPCLPLNDPQEHILPLVYWTSFLFIGLYDGGAVTRKIQLEWKLKFLLVNSVL